MYVNRKGVGITQPFLIEMALNIHEKRLVIQKRYQIVKSEKKIKHFEFQKF